MGKAKGDKAVSGSTGRYAFCPASNSAHGLCAVHVQRSANGNHWFGCPCGTRVYFPKGMLPKMTRAMASQVPGCQIIGDVG